ncbi:unnamed protein product [Dovyalis caffra]|uniref:Uncharacterized protein n=1 Tax=Dovyalis caffra TaxID=77055 RepID=A0AAV1QQY4_9ROSI|nr:unnamed protein product [Dovyalis caffra]
MARRGSRAFDKRKGGHAPLILEEDRRSKRRADGISALAHSAYMPSNCKHVQEEPAEARVGFVSS